MLGRCLPFPHLLHTTLLYCDSSDLIWFATNVKMSKLNSVICFTYSRVRILSSYSRVLFVPPGKNQLLKKSFSYTYPNVQTHCCVSTLAEQLRRKDNVPSDYQIIYRGPLTSYVAPAQACYTGTALVIFGCFVNYFYSSSAAFEHDFIMFGSMLFVMNIAVYKLIRKYVLRIYVNKDGSYIAMIPSAIPFLHTKIEYSQGEVKRLDPTGFLPWKHSKFSINSKKVIIIENYFRIPSDFNTMLTEK